MVAMAPFTYLKEASVRLEHILFFNKHSRTYTVPAYLKATLASLIGRSYRFFRHPKRQSYREKFNNKIRYFQHSKKQNHGKKSNKLHKTDKKSKTVKRGYPVRRSRRKTDKKLKMKPVVVMTPVDEIMFRVAPNHLNGYSGTFIYSEYLDGWTEIEPKSEYEVEYDPHAMLNDKRVLLVSLRGQQKKESNFCFNITDQSEFEEEDEKPSENIDNCDEISIGTNEGSTDSGFNELLNTSPNEQQMCKKSRYPKRMSRQRNLDSNSFEDCNTFERYGCSEKSEEHVHLEHVVDRPFMYQNGDLNYAMLSLPHILRIGPSGLGEGDLGVFTKTFVPMGTVFGPYCGEKKSVLYKKASDYCWAICDRYCDRFVIDGSNTRKSNWLRYVNCARNNAEENLVGVVTNKQLYYMASKNIPPDTQLLVYYGDFFAKQLKIDLFQFKKAKMKVQYKGMSVHQNIVSVYANGAQAGKIHLRSELNSSSPACAKRRVLFTYLRQQRFRFSSSLLKDKNSLEDGISPLTENPVAESLSVIKFPAAVENRLMIEYSSPSLTKIPSDSLDRDSPVDEFCANRDTNTNMDSDTSTNCTDESVLFSDDKNCMDVESPVCVQDSLNLQSPPNLKISADCITPA